MPLPFADGVNVTWQLALAPLPDNVHGLPLKFPEPLLTENVTVPVGVLGVPWSVSVTVAVQVVGWPTATCEGEQPTLVEVERTAQLITTSGADEAVVIEIPLERPAPP
jgi:hypothetical protein